MLSSENLPLLKSSMSSPVFYEPVAGKDDDEDDISEQDEKKEHKEAISDEDIREEILRMFDSANTLTIQELNDVDTAKMVQTQKEYETFGKFICGHKWFAWAKKNKLMICNVLFLVTGLLIAEFVLKDRNKQRYEQVYFYTIYTFGLILCISITKIILYLIMKLLRSLIKNSWRVFYMKDLENRLFLSLLCILWYFAFKIFAYLYGYDYNEKIYKIVKCLWISSCMFLFTHLLIRAIALSSYFDIFRQRVRKLKAYIFFIEIMLDLPTHNTLFCIPLMNFLIDFPTNRTAKAAKQTASHIAFTFSSQDINMTADEILEIMAMADNKLNFESNFILANIDEAVQLKVVSELLQFDIYSIDLNDGKGTSQKISKENLNRLSMLLSCLIMLRLNETKRTKILTKAKYNKSQSASHSKSSSIGIKMKALIKYKYFSAGKLSMSEVENNDSINEECFIQSFKEYNSPNKRLLIDLGKLAWKKFSDKDNDTLHTQILNINICQIIHDLLSVKQSIDSYVVIIRNLQRLIDILTPILLLFVYLYIFNLDFQQTLTLYVSSVGIIGFFGASYFGSIFASISFIIALNPFLVGDKIYLNNDFYKVREISLISCMFENLRTGWYHTFQNKLLASSKQPIINLTRSKVMRYRWILFFKSQVNNEFLYQFTLKCKKEIEAEREKELKILENHRRHLINDKNKNRSSFCTFAELKTINFESIMFKSVKLDEYGRKCVWLEMKYQIYSWNVITLCFNCITAVANNERYKEYICNNVPLQMDHAKEGFVNDT